MHDQTPYYGQPAYGGSTMPAYGAPAYAQSSPYAQPAMYGVPALSVYSVPSPTFSHQSYSPSRAHYGVASPSVNPSLYPTLSHESGAYGNVPGNGPTSPYYAQQQQHQHVQQQRDAAHVGAQASAPPQPAEDAAALITTDMGVKGKQQQTLTGDGPTSAGEAASSVPVNPAVAASHAGHQADQRDHAAAEQGSPSSGQGPCTSASVPVPAAEGSEYPALSNALSQDFQSMSLGGTTNANPKPPQHAPPPSSRPPRPAVMSAFTAPPASVLEGGTNTGGISAYYPTISGEDSGIFGMSSAPPTPYPQQLATASAHNSYSQPASPAGWGQAGAPAWAATSASATYSKDPLVPAWSQPAVPASTRPGPLAYAPPPQYSLPSPTAMPPAGGPRKKALVVACSYPRTAAALKGCINDAECMSYALKKHFGFTEDNIVMLRDDGKERSPEFKSTRASIISAISWLMSNNTPGTSLVFHFSGHGSQKKAVARDEDDGYDETICPSDYERAGQIVDNELNQKLVNPLQQGVVLHCVVDACHSGTALDLSYTTEYEKRKQSFRWHGIPLHNKGTSGGTAIQFGACRDSQVAQDTSNLSGAAYTGAATFSFIKALEASGPRQTYAQLLANMTSTLHAATKSSNANASASHPGLMSSLLFGSLLQGRSEAQQPVLSCDKLLDLNTPLMI